LASLACSVSFLLRLVFLSFFFFSDALQQKDRKGTKIALSRLVGLSLPVCVFLDVVLVWAVVQSLHFRVPGSVLFV
jgi:hypothetical protein